MFALPLMSESVEILFSRFSELFVATPLPAEAAIVADEGGGTTRLADARHWRDYPYLLWLLMLPLLFAITVGFRRWRRLALAYRLPLASRFRVPKTGKVDALRERHAMRHKDKPDERTEVLMELYRLYTRGDVDMACEGLRRHLEWHPFELNFYVVCLNMLAEKSVHPSPEMIRLIRHALRQLKVHRPRMWQTVSEYGHRLVPDFDHWDEQAALSTHRRPRR